MSCVKLGAAFLQVREFEWSGKGQGKIFLEKSQRKSKRGISDLLTSKGM